MGVNSVLKQAKPTVAARFRKRVALGMRRFFAAPVFEGDEERTRLANLLNMVLMVVLMASLLGSVAALVIEPASAPPLNLVFGVAVAVVVFVLRFFLHRGHVQAIGLLMSLVLWVGITLVLATSGGLGNATVVGYFVLVAVTGLLLGGDYGYLFTALGSLAILGLYYSETKGFIAVPAGASTGLAELVRLIMALVLMALLVRFTGRSFARVVERARENERVLAERNRELEANQRVASSVSERVSPDELLGLVVDLIRDQFDLYHVQVYIVDEERQAAVLRESTGYAGYQLLQRGHRIPLDYPALVVQAISQGEPVLMNDVSQAPNFMPNPLLPDTESELVVPLKIGDRVIGVLDAQARAPDRFTESTVALFQMTADQIAFLFENSELLEGISERTEALTALATQLRTAADIAVQASTILIPERLLREVVELLQVRFGLYHAHVYLLDEEANRLTVEAGSGEVGRVLRERRHGVSLAAEKSLVARAARIQRVVLVNDTSLESDFVPTPLLPQTRSEMSVPLMAGNKVLGVLDLQDDQTGRFTQVDLDTFGILAGQIAAALQNARLFEEQQQARKALRESEDRYRDLVEHGHDLVSTHDLEGRILSVNQEAARILGYDRDDLLQKSVRDLLAPEFRDEFDAYLATIREHGVASGLMQVRTSTGESRVWEYNNILRTEGLDKPIVRAMAHDITEVKEAERALRRSEAKYRTLFANIADPIVIFDQETKLFLDYNQATLDRYGYSRRELRAMTPYQLHPPDDLEAVDENIDNKEDSSAHLYTHITKDGRTIPVETHTAEIEYEGRPAWISIIRDISERVRSEEERAQVEEARERLANQQRIAADLTERINAILDPDELLRQVATQLRDRFDLYQVQVYLLEDESRDLVMRAGASEAGAASSEPGHMIPSNRRNSPVARAARDRAAVLIKDPGVRAGLPSGMSLPEVRSEVAVPLVVGDKVLGVLDVQDGQVNRFTQSDLSVLSTLAGQIAIALQNASLFEEVRTTTEQLREADYLKSDLLSRLNHELRTPLNSILGYAEIMMMALDGELDPRSLEYVRSIHENGKQLARVINDAIDLARIEDHRLELHYEEIQISSLVDEVGSSVTPLLANKPVQWVVDVEENIPPIRGDRVRLNQVLNSVVANAVRFTSEGHIKLCASSKNGWVCIEVEDTGIGIDEGELASMFARMKRSDILRIQKSGVTGLDMVIACYLVQMHGGEIEARSQPEQGSTFTIRLPVLRQAAEAVAGGS